jgi:Xaa-Pro aminopeptidase
VAIHFSKKELKARRDAACRAMHERELDALLLFKQESMCSVANLNRSKLSVVRIVETDCRRD